MHCQCFNCDSIVSDSPGAAPHKTMGAMGMSMIVLFIFFILIRYTHAHDTSEEQHISRLEAEITNPTTLLPTPV